MCASHFRYLRTILYNMDDSTTFAAWRKTIATGHDQYGLLSFGLCQYRPGGPIAVTLSEAAHELQVAKNTLRDRIKAIKPEGILTEEMPEMMQRLKAVDAIGPAAQKAADAAQRAADKAADAIKRATERKKD